ncbi:MAG TPA: ribonuclease J [Alphaproteobacteria bacterium]|nr:MBL fold hydrolase [Rhodospirillaceae bacterium]HRJ12606.1 ribonuclease J [Alphaproteobacteria bacterium]
MKDKVTFLPLGGCGEFGVNLNLFSHNDEWLMVDFGMGFAGDELPGIDIILPDIKFIEERKEKLLGILITHAHEDHIGAIPHLWMRLRAPIYATPFTAQVIRMKMKEAGLLEQLILYEIPLGGSKKFGPFEVQLINVAHSIPEPNLLVIKTPVGNIVHTGDWKFDDSPVEGSTTNRKTLQNIGKEGVLALIGDSTNAATPGRSGSEGDLSKSLNKIFLRYPDRRIVVTSFASNIARLKSVALAAKAAGRVMALAGRSLWRMNEAARKTGYMTDLPPFLSEREATMVGPGEIVIMATGSQGEPRAAMARMAAGDHPQLDLSPNDVVIFSARAIPGNEKDIARVQTNLRARSVNVITDHEEFVHVSGHPAYDDVMDLIQWLKPKVLLPVHGEVYQLQAHAKIGEALQVPQILIPRDGDVIELTTEGAKVVDEVHHGLLCLDGKKVVPVTDQAIKSRVKLAELGTVLVSLAIDEDGSLVSDPAISTHGIYDEAGQEAGEMELMEIVIAAIEDLDDRHVMRDESVEQAARIAVRRAVNQSHGRKPVAEVHVHRV